LTHASHPRVLGLEVADLRLWLDAQKTGISLAAPEPYGDFLVPGTPGRGLILRLRDGHLQDTSGWNPLYSHPETWQIWQDREDRLLFVAPGQSLPDQGVIVDAGFTDGDVVGSFGSLPEGTSLFPLQDIDIVLFSNWLAGSGDLILHAAAVEMDGRGYCFVGGPGVGKSTLAALLAEHSAAHVLGEDNAILRCLEGHFWIFGTPWHEDPARCSPAGAPLDKVFLLDRNAAQGVVPVRPIDAIACLLQTAFVPYYRPEAVSRILDNLALLAERVPFFSLSYQFEEDVAQLILNA
jgi:hypothetical protein